jgi:hypothetical protein
MITLDGLMFLMRGFKGNRVDNGITVNEFANSEDEHLDANLTSINLGVREEPLAPVTDETSKAFDPTGVGFGRRPRRRGNTIEGLFPLSELF